MQLSTRSQKKVSSSDNFIKNIANHVEIIKNIKIRHDKIIKMNDLFEYLCENIDNISKIKEDSFDNLLLCIFIKTVELEHDLLFTKTIEYELEQKFLHNCLCTRRNLMPMILALEYKPKHEPYYSQAYNFLTLFTQKK